MSIIYLINISKFFIGGRHGFKFFIKIYEIIIKTLHGRHYCYPQLIKLMHKVVKQLTPGHTASKWYGWNSASGIYASTQVYYGTCKVIYSL